ncbi:MAG: capsular biosynthesis protein, partial [Ignavibacteria bacterium]|nr:capsular biosynthesis protein [Ignavibacteria bacterium]
MKLVIISHTPHYKKNGVIVGWGSTITEVNHLTKLFSEIYHIAPLHNEAAPDSSLAYESEKIKFIPISIYGGVNLKNKLSVLTTAPGNLKTISSVLKKSGSNDWIQFRAPTAMGVYVIPYLSFFRKSKLWVKYAGNWNMDNPPLSYKFQKWWLENNFQNSKVTINGYWEGQKSHIINFQNPCMDSEELLKAKEKSKSKNFDGKLSICFVGALSKNKGV